MSEVETNDVGAPKEEAFFGVKHTVNKPSGEDIDIEVVDNRSPEDQKYGEPESSSSQLVESSPAGNELDDEELEHYSEKVQKRINKLTYDKHEFRRKAEEAAQEREEAIRAAQIYQRQAMEQQKILAQGEQRLFENIKQRTEMELESAKLQYRQAYEEGNTDKIIEAQEAMIRANADMRAVDYELQRFSQPQRPPQQQRAPQQHLAPRQQQRPPQPQVSEKAKNWASNNPWFSDPEKRDEEMAATALGIHEKLISKEGYHPESDEYYQELDKRIRKRYPERFKSTQSASSNVVVAPVERNNGGAQRKVTLNRRQVAIAKRLRLTPQQYAEQLLKEAERNG